MRNAAALLLLAAWLGGCGGAAPVEPRADAPLSKVDPAPPKSTPAAPPPAARADSAAAPEPLASEREVAVDLGAQRRAELVVQARKDVVEAERMIAGYVPTADTARNEKVRAVEGLITQARSALETDPDAAATLAHKARLLAEEIAAAR